MIVGRGDRAWLIAVRGHAHGPFLTSVCFCPASGQSRSDVYGVTFPPSKETMQRLSPWKILVVGSFEKWSANQCIAMKCHVHILYMQDHMHWTCQMHRVKQPCIRSFHPVFRPSVHAAELNQCDDVWLKANANQSSLLKTNDNVCSKSFLSQKQNNFRSCCPWGLRVTSNII